MSLGLQRGIVKLSDYNPEWSNLFQQEKDVISSTLEDKLLGVEHIGSTAIPGIKSKPILDLMIAIKSLNDWEELKEPLGELGYEFRRDSRSLQQHILFVKGPEEKRTHYLKVAEINSDFWKEHILFRDYLIAHPDKAKEYENLKMTMLKAHEGNRDPYTKGKEVFVKDVLRLAGYKGKVV
jgi:GrpB-like predicted nucleotidyltransferase (UPF0157 family)